jgi:hypothetical protein
MSEFRTTRNAIFVAVSSLIESRSWIFEREVLFF